MLFLKGDCMRWKIVCVGCVVASALLGCNDNSTTTSPATAPSASALPGVDAMKGTADRVMGDVETAISDKKWDAADAAMTQLEKLKPSLPAEYAGKIDALRKKLDDAKAAAPKPATAP
jgi:hypothetical protein